MFTGVTDCGGGKKRGVVSKGRTSCHRGLEVEKEGWVHRRGEGALVTRTRPVLDYSREIGLGCSRKELDELKSHRESDLLTRENESGRGHTRRYCGVKETKGGWSTDEEQ